MLAAALIEYAMPVGSLIGLGAFAIAGTNWAYAMLRARAEDSPKVEREPGGEEGSAADSFQVNMRWALLTLFLSFFWVFLVFLADSIWGDSVSRPMALGFVVLVAGGAVGAMQGISHDSSGAP